MLEVILISAAMAALIYYFGIKPMSYWKDLGVKQTDKVWFLGDNWRNVFKIESFAEMIVRIYNRFPETRYVGMCQFNVPTLVIKDPELLKQICVKDFDHFVDHRSFLPEDVEPLFGKNLFSLTAQYICQNLVKFSYGLLGVEFSTSHSRYTIEHGMSIRTDTKTRPYDVNELKDVYFYSKLGQSWRDMRPILTPSFTGSKMKHMFEFMSECAQNFTNYFLKKDQNIVEIELKDAFSRYTNDVIATTAFGVKTDSLEDRTNEFYMMGKLVTNFNTFKKRMKFFGFFLFPKLLQFFKIGLFETEVNQFFTHIVNDNIDTRKKKGIVRQDMLHLLIEAQKQKQANIDQESISGKSHTKEMTNLDIAAQAMIFFFAGFDGISTIMCFMAYEIATNPDIQKKLAEEVDDTLKECGGSLTYDALLKMKYMDMVVSETLRKWSGPFVDRVCTKPYTIEATKPEEKALHLKKGTVLMLPIYALHHDAALYPNPERFDPERFSDDNKGNINPFAYIPFGVGPRSCIGNRFALLEIKVAMFHILSKFEIVPTSKTTIPIKMSKTNFNIVPDDGFPLGLKRRN